MLRYRFWKLHTGFGLSFPAPDPDTYNLRIRSFETSALLHARLLGVLEKRGLDKSSFVELLYILENLIERQVIKGVKDAEEEESNLYISLLTLRLHHTIRPFAAPF
jgi:hypothetical protein